MTLIIGLQCSDGVILAADRKVIRGGETSFADKIFERAGIVMAFEGLTGLRDDFLILLDTEAKRAGGFADLYSTKLIVEDIVAELSERY
jgi:20S proteasome alpha/beta subunit